MESFALASLAGRLQRLDWQRFRRLEAFDSEPWCVSRGISCIGPTSLKGFASRGIRFFQHQRQSIEQAGMREPVLRQRSAQDQGRAGSAPSLAICAWLPVVSRLHPMLQRVRGQLRKWT